MRVLLPLVHNRSDESNEESDCSSFGDNKLIPSEVNPPEVSVPRGLISTSRMRKIITRYHILPNFVCRVLDSNEYISTSGPLEVIFFFVRRPSGLD